MVDKAILSMNRAAEEASKSAAPIFVDAIKSMSIQDAVGILKGSDSAATVYLKGKTTASLTSAFQPVIEKRLKKQMLQNTGRMCLKHITSFLQLSIK